MILEVVFNIPLFNHFDYILPADKAPSDLDSLIGRRVLAPFGFRNQLGIVIGVKESTESKFKLKSIASFLDDKPFLSPSQMRLGKFLSEQTLSSLGEALFALLPLDPYSSNGEPSTPRALESKTEREFALTLEQKTALEELDKLQDKPALLFGVSASGKTEVYVELAKKALSKGKSVLCLAPEIGLAEQIFDTFQKRLGSTAVLWHSGITRKERIRLWWAIRTGEIRVIVGTRSAIFLPFPDLGLIIVDEEHDGAYQEDQKPRFHAREVALFRAHEEKSFLVFGTSTPSLDLWEKVQNDEVAVTHLTERVVQAAKPEIKVVDLKKEKPHGSLSPTLIAAIADRLQKKEQVLLFINKRGFHRFARCAECGWTAKCPNCGVSLIHHKKKPVRIKGKNQENEESLSQLICHTCTYSMPTVPLCPQCKKPKIFLGGIGTERVEDEVTAQFPWAHVIRWDRDSAQRKGERGKITEQILEGPVDVIVGTQLLAQGLHFPKVTLAGVIDADGPLHIPDFRSSEKAYQLIAQVAGRAGRSEVQGSAIVQTRSPDHYAVSHAINLDYEGFAKTELEYRKDLSYPPATRLVLVRSTLKKGKTTPEDLEKISQWVSQHERWGEFAAFGPFPSRGKMGKKSFELTIKVPTGLFVDFSNSFRKFLVDSRLNVTIDAGCH